MRKSRTLLTMILIFSIAPLCGFAQETDEKAPKVYSSSTSFSALVTTGNSKDLTISIDTDQNLKFEKDKLSFKANLIYAHSNSRNISEIYSSSLKYNRQIDKRTYLLGMTTFSRNVSSGNRSRIAFSAGAGYSWIMKPKIEVSSDIALGWSTENNAEKLVQQVIDNTIKPINKINRASFLSSIITTKVTLNISSNAQIIHQDIIFLNLKVLAGYRITSHSALMASISKYFALKTSIQVMYENRPVPGHKTTDLYILSSIVFKI
ncbi:DUF481 domain-containing protein [Acidobacteriota bacterium]